jgi:deazaflavin-dependent oxidoreductase (nitroreductase family)
MKHIVKETGKMLAEIQKALATDLTIDITTIGRKTGQPRRLEIWFYYVDGVPYLSGSPGKRDWYANLLANPNFTFHFKESIKLDIPATAYPIEDEAERRTIMAKIIKIYDGGSSLEAWVAGSPLMRIVLHPEHLS